MQPGWTEACPRGALRLDPATVDLWSIGLDGVGSRSCGELLGVLSVDERARMARFRHERDARRWGIARGATREVLASYVGIAPSKLVFRQGTSGKPALETGDGVRFNVSHSGPEALIAVARGFEVGVDVELIREGLLEDAIAQRVPGDLAVRLATIESPRVRTRTFFRAWVCHEATVKCRGIGISEVASAGLTDHVWIGELDLGEEYAAALAVDVVTLHVRPVVRRLVWQRWPDVGAKLTCVAPSDHAPDDGRLEVLE